MCFCDLWVAILASTGAVFVASFVLWMALPLHKGDHQVLPSEPEFKALLAQHDPPVGRYTIGWRGPDGTFRTPPDPTLPRGLLLVQRGALSMGKPLVFWALHLLVVSVLVAYTSSIVLPHGADGTTVFRLTSVIALLAYGGGAVPKAIWDGVPWKQVPTALVDALVYAAVTGGVFLWLWPKAA